MVVDFKGNMAAMKDLQGHPVFCVGDCVKVFLSLVQEFTFGEIIEMSQDGFFLCNHMDNRIAFYKWGEIRTISKL